MFKNCLVFNTIAEGEKNMLCLSANLYHVISDCVGTCNCKVICRNNVSYLCDVIFSREDYVCFFQVPGGSSNAKSHQFCFKNCNNSDFSFSLCKGLTLPTDTPRMESFGLFL